MLNKLNSNDLKSVTGGIGQDGTLPAQANPLGQPSYGMVFTLNGLLCNYKGSSATNGTPTLTFNDTATAQHDLILLAAAGPTGLPPPVGVDASGCPIY